MAPRKLHVRLISGHDPAAANRPQQAAAQKQQQSAQQQAAAQHSSSGSAAGGSAEAAAAAQQQAAAQKQQQLAQQQAAAQKQQQLAQQQAATQNSSSRHSNRRQRRRQRQEARQQAATQKQQQTVQQQAAAQQTTAQKRSPAIAAKGSTNVVLPFGQPSYKSPAINANPEKRGYCYPQCVEFVKFNFGFPAGWAYAKEYWTKPQSGYVNYPQGAKRAPRPGDLLVWSGTLNPDKPKGLCPKDGCGHVAIVKSVDLVKGALIRVDANWKGTCGIVEHAMTISGDDRTGYTIAGSGEQQPIWLAVKMK